MVDDCGGDGHMVKHFSGRGQFSQALFKMFGHEIGGQSPAAKAGCVSTALTKSTLVVTPSM